MDAAYRSLVAFWLGGAEATPETPAGYGSMLAFWVGGVGWPARPAPTPSGKGKTVGGKFSAVYRAAAVEEYTRTVLGSQRNEALQQQIAQRVLLNSWLRQIEAEHQQKCLEWAAYSVVLAEV